MSSPILPAFKSHELINNEKKPEKVSKTPFSSHSHQKTIDDAQEPSAKTPFSSYSHQKSNKDAQEQAAKTPFSSYSYQKSIKDAQELSAKTPFSSYSYQKTFKDAPEQVAKTPFSSYSYQRNFQSEIQPNRVASRIYPSTSHRYRSTCSYARVAQTEKKEDISKTQQQYSIPSIKYQVQVNDKTYKILKKIGSGGSAKVYEGFDSKTSHIVAIKIINVAQADPRTQESYFNEKSILTKLRGSRHVVHMFDAEYKEDCKELIIVMEKGDADLSQVIDTYFKNKDNIIDGIFIKFYWRGMLQAVNSIHKLGIIHADLKPVNFIIVRNEIKLIDFGIASAIAPEGTSIVRDYQIGTINYMAPEALKNHANDINFSRIGADENQHHEQKKTLIKYNSKADIWSLGCILYNLVYGRPPYDTYKDVISKAQAIIDPKHKIYFPEISNKNLLNCMKSCLRYNPNDRPTAEELLNDPYLKEDIVRLQNT